MGRRELGGALHATCPASRGRPARSRCSRSRSIPASARHASCAGELDAGAALIGEAEAVSEAIGTAARAVRRAALAAWRGREAETLGADPRRTLDDAGEPRRGHAVIGSADYAAAVLYNGLGRYARRSLAAAAGVRAPRTWASSTWALAELIEAAARSGRARASRPTRSSGSREPTRAGGTDWALGHRGRARGAAQRRRRRRGPLPRGDRAARPHPRRASSSPAPTCSTANGCAASAAGWTRASSCAPPTRCSARWAPRRSPSARARELLATGETARKRPAETRDAAHRPGGPDRAARPRRPLQPGDRRPAVHQPAHRRVPPAQGLRQARHQLAPRALAALPETSRAAMAP